MKKKSTEYKNRLKQIWLDNKNPQMTADKFQATYQDLLIHPDVLNNLGLPKLRQFIARVF